MSEITRRQYEALCALSGGLVESRAGLHPAGEGTIKAMLSAGWIEEVPEGAVGRQMGYRITEAGEAVYRTGSMSRRPRKPSRLKTLPPRLPSLPPRIGKLD